ncbi:MAG: peptide chain release factor 3, partial [Rhodospirillaceae bacterium]|nr:peptide chain release factor 3 [Rhodospirillaceae bacterium]
MTLHSLESSADPTVPTGAGSRRTFAIISHPDAGKTTLTEKLLLFGGAIRLAGDVKARGDRRRARSDWMKIEQARGISVTTSVMTFDYGGLAFNLLDTPGHEDFSEDTYRTLTAVDSAVMVIDAAKGIEPQTRKLFEVCRLRDVPIMTFINKLDREALDPFELLDQISDQLALDISPITWPVGMGQAFQGCYDLTADRMLFLEGPRQRAGNVIACNGLDDPVLAAHLPASLHTQLTEEAELARGGYPTFDPQSYRQGHMTGVFFGSALRNFGVRELLDGLARYAPAPRPQPAADDRTVDPEDDRVSGFVFKVQANMDKNHRDRVAFLRLCSGRFQRGMKLTQTRTGKTMAVHNPIFFFAQDRQLAEEAWAGDIIGVPNHGALRVGDTLSEAAGVRFTGLPDFAPEILQRVRLDDPMRAKHLRAALNDMAEEGVTQVFKPLTGGAWIVGVVGALQLDVLSTRLDSEYNV